MFFVDVLLSCGSGRRRSFLVHSALLRIVTPLPSPRSRVSTIISEISLISRPNIVVVFGYPPDDHVNQIIAKLRQLLVITFMKIPAFHIQNLNISIVALYVSISAALSLLRKYQLALKILLFILQTLI